MQPDDGFSMLTMTAANHVIFHDESIIVYSEGVLKFIEESGLYAYRTFHTLEHGSSLKS